MFIEEPLELFPSRFPIQPLGWVQINLVGLSHWKIASRQRARRGNDTDSGRTSPAKRVQAWGGRKGVSRWNTAGKTADGGKFSGRDVQTAGPLDNATIKVRPAH